jgi:hypothetical protein
VFDLKKNAAMVEKKKKKKRSLAPFLAQLHPPSQTPHTTRPPKKKSAEENATRSDGMCIYLKKKRPPYGMVKTPRMFLTVVGNKDICYFFLSRSFLYKNTTTSFRLLFFVATAFH